MGKVDGELGGHVTEILLGVVAVLVLGLPLLALGADKVLPAFKNKPVGPSPMQLLARKHHLGGADIAEVEAAVAQGRVVRRPRLAAAAVALAEQVLLENAWGESPGQRRLVTGRVRVVLVVVGLVLLVFAGWLFAARQLDLSVLGFVLILNTLFQVAQAPLLRRAARRRKAAARVAVEANQPAAAAVAGPA